MVTVWWSASRNPEYQRRCSQPGLSISESSGGHGASRWRARRSHPSRSRRDLARPVLRWAYTRCRLSGSRLRSSGDCGLGRPPSSSRPNPLLRCVEEQRLIAARHRAAWPALHRLVPIYHVDPRGNTRSSPSGTYQADSGGYRRDAGKQGGRPNRAGERRARRSGGSVLQQRHEELRALFADVALRVPDARIVRGNSWLYNLEASRPLFPSTYTTRMPLSNAERPCCPVAAFFDFYGVPRPSTSARPATF